MDKKYNDDNVLEKKTDVVLVEGNKELVFGKDWEGNNQNVNMTYASYKNHMPVRTNKESDKKEGNEVTIDFNDTFKGTTSNKELSEISPMIKTFSNMNETRKPSLAHQMPSQEKKIKSVLEENLITKKKKEPGLFGIISQKLFGSEKKNENIRNKDFVVDAGSKPLKVIKNNEDALNDLSQVKEYHQNEFIGSKNNYVEVYENENKNKFVPLNVELNEYSINHNQDPEKSQTTLVDKKIKSSEIQTEKSKEHTNTTHTKEPQENQTETIKQTNNISPLNKTNEQPHTKPEKNTDQNQEQIKNNEKPIKKKNKFKNWGKLTKNKLKDELKK